MEKQTTKLTIWSVISGILVTLGYFLLIGPIVLVILLIPWGGFDDQGYVIMVFIFSWGVSIMLFLLPLVLYIRSKSIVGIIISIIPLLLIGSVFALYKYQESQDVSKVEAEAKTHNQKSRQLLDATYKAALEYKSSNGKYTSDIDQLAPYLSEENKNMLGLNGSDTSNNSMIRIPDYSVRLLTSEICIDLDVRDPDARYPYRYCRELP